MFTKKIKDLKNTSYIFLTLLSTATTSLSMEYTDEPVRGGSIKVPCRKESVIDSLEKRIKLLFEAYDTQEDEVQKDIQSPPMDGNMDRYTPVKNKVIDRYEKERPQLSRFRTSPPKLSGKPSLMTQALTFANTTEELKNKFEQENKDIQKGMETTVNVGGSLIESIIDNKVNDPAKGVLLDLLGKTKEGFLTLFR